MAELTDWGALLDYEARAVMADRPDDWGALLDIEFLKPAIRKRIAGGIGPLKPSLAENLGIGFGIGKDLDDEAARTIVADSGMPSSEKRSVELAQRLDRLYRIARADMLEQFNDVELRARVPKDDRELYLDVLQDLGANAAPELGPVGKFSTRVARGIEGMFTGVERSAVELAGTKEAQDEYRWLATRQQIKRGALPATSENLFMRGLYAAGEMAPPMVASALTMKGLTGLVGAKTATAGQMGFWGAQEFPGLMDELRAGGASDVQAKSIAVPAAALIGVIELWERPWNALGISDGVKNAARQTARKAALGFAKSWGKEWGEEAMQQGVSHVAKEVNAVIDQNVSIDRKKEWESAKSELLDAALALPFMLGPGHAARGLQDFQTGKKQATLMEAWKGSPSAHAAVSLTGMSDDERRAFVESQADRWVSELDPRTAAERIAAVESLATPMKGEIDVGEYPSRKAFSQATGFPLPSGPDRQAFVDRVRKLHQQAVDAAKQPAEEKPNAEAVRSDQGPDGEPGGPVRQGTGTGGGDLQQQTPGQPDVGTPQREVPAQREAEEAALERARLIDRIAGIFDWAPKQALAGLPLEELRALEQQPMLKLETTLRGLAEQRPPEPPQEPAAEVPMPEPTGKRLKPVPAAAEPPPAEPQSQQPVQQLIDRLQVLVEAGDDTARALQYYLSSPRIPATQRDATINAAAEYLAEKEQALGQQSTPSPGQPTVRAGLPAEPPTVDRGGKGLGPQAKAPVVPEQPSAEQPQAAPAEAQPEARPPEPAAEQPPAVPPGRGPVVGEGIPENVPEPEMVAGVLQPWEMTQGEYVDQDKAVMAADEAMVNATGRSKSKKAEGIWRRRLMEAQSAHHAIVAAAVKKGFPVASKVLADYPDLQSSTAVQPPAEPGGKGMAKVPVEEQAPVSGQTGSTPGGPDAATVASEAQPAGAEPSPAAPPVAKPAEALPPATPAVALAATASMGRGLRTPERPVGERGATEAEMPGPATGATQANAPEPPAPAGRGLRLKPVIPRGQTALPGLEPEAASREEEDRFADLAISAIQDVVTPEAAEQSRGILRRVPSLIRKWGKIEADRMLGDLDYDEIKTMTTEELADAVDQQVWENIGDLPPVGLGDLRARPIGTASQDKALDKAEERRNDMILDAIAQETRRSLGPEVERVKAEAARRQKAESGQPPETAVQPPSTAPEKPASVIPPPSTVPAPAESPPSPVPAATATPSAVPSAVTPPAAATEVPAEPQARPSGLPRLTEADTIDLSGLSDQQLRHLAKRHKPNTYSQIADIGKSVQDEIRRRGIKDYTEGPAEAKPLLDAYMKARSAREDAEMAVTTAHTHRNSVEHAMIQDEARKRGVPLGGRGKHGLSAAKQYVNKVHDAKNAAQKRPELAKAQDAIRDAEHKVRDAKAAEEAADREWARAAASGMPQIPAGQKRRAIEGYGNQVVVREFDPERGQYRVEGLGGNEYYVSPQPLLDNYMSEEEASQAKAIEDAFSEAARTAESKRVAKGQAEFQQKQAEASASKKVRDKERFINTRFWNQLKNRANALGTTKQEEKIVEKDGIVKLKREIIDDTWMVRQEPKTEDGKAGGFSLVHRPTNTVASTGNTANEAKQLYLLAIQDGGIDLSKLKEGEKITPEQAKLFRSIERAWDKQDLGELGDDDQSKALKAKWLESAKAPAPGFTADMVLDGSDFVEADAAVARIKMLASGVPEFAYDPVFTVDADKKLVYRDGFKYRFEPKALNVEPFYLKPGMTVGINLEDLGIKRKTPQDVVAEALSQQGFTVSRSKAGTVKAKWKLRTITAQPDANDPTSWSILEQNPDADRAREIVNAIRWRQPGQEAPQKTLTTIPGGKVESGISGPPQEQAGYTKKERKELAQKMKMAESVRKKRKGKPLQPAPSAEAQPAAEPDAQTAIEHAELRRRLRSVDNKTNRRGYQPLSDAEHGELVASGYVHGNGKRKGKLTDKGYQQLREFERQDRADANAEAESVEAHPAEPESEAEASADVQGMRIPSSPSRDDIDYMEQHGLRGAEYWQHVDREAAARGIPIQSPEGDNLIDLAKGVNAAKQLKMAPPAADGADAVFVQRMMGEKAAASRPGGGVHAQVAPEGPSAAYPRPTTAPAGAEPGQAEYERRGAAVEVPPPTEDAKAKRIEAQPIPMPELIQLVKELLGDVPSVKRLRKYLGFFQGQEGGFGRMVINAIAAKDEVLLAKVLAHEAGHMVDWLPEHTLKRGNILGRIASLHGYLKHWLEGKPGGPGPLTEADRARLRREAERTMKKGAEVEIEEEIVERFSITPDDILNIWNSVEEDANKDLVNYIKRLSSAEKLSLIKEAFRGVVPEEVQKFAKEIRHKTGRKITKTVETSATPEEVHAKYLDLLREEAQKRQLLSLENIREELIRLTEWWTPFDRRTSTKDYIAYRESSPELYAEALSVFLNSPHELAKRAPEFYRGFCGWLSNKPDVMDTFWSIQETLGGGADKVSAEREAIRRAMYLEADQKILAARQARENARLHPLAAVRSFLSQYVLHRAAPIRGRALKSSSAEAKAAFYTADELAYSENRSYRMLQRIRDEVWKPLLDVGITQEDIGDYLFMRRVVNERNEIANPLGYVPSEAARELDQMRKKLGDEKFTALEERMKAWHDILFESVEAAVDAGVYSQENFDKIKENKDNYATFAVIKYLEDYVSPAIRQQIGTFQGIANPWDATTMKFIALNRLIELNSAKTTVRDMLRKHFDKEIRAVPVPYGKNEPSETPRPGFKFVSILEDGKVRFYEVPSEIATSFKRSDIGGFARFSAIAQSFVYRVFHPLFVTYNPGFIVANPVRDLRRTWINLGTIGSTLHQQLVAELVANGMSHDEAKKAAAPQKISAWQVFRAFWQSRRDAKKYVTGVEDEAVNEMIAQKALSVPYVDIAAEAGEPGEAKRMMEHYGLTDQTQKQTRNLAFRFVGAILEAIHREGAVQEVAGKLSAWNLLTQRMESAKELGVDLISERERAHLVRRYAGTPDFKQKGLATPILNSVWMYSNVKWQGLVSDLELATDSKTAAGWWWRRIASDIIPTTMTKIALYGGFGAATAAILSAIGTPPDDDEYDPLGLKRMTRRIGSYFLDNYDVIPIGTVHDVTGADDKAKTLFVTIPKDETGRIISKIWSNLLDVALEQAGATTKAGIPRKAWSNIFGATKDALVPNMAPPLDIASAWREYAAGINPHDAYFDSDVVPPNAWKAGGWPATRRMLAWTQDKFGIAGDAASVLTSPFLGQAFSPDDMTTIEQVLAVPTGHHRFLRISDRGLSESEWAEIEAVERESAQFRESLPPEVRYLTREYFRSSKLDESTLSPSRKIEMHLQNRWYYGTYLPITRKIKAGEGDPDALRAELEQSAKRVIDASKASVSTGVDNAKQFPTYRESQPEYVEKHKVSATRPVRKSGEDAEHYGKRLEKWTDAKETYGTRASTGSSRGRSLRQPRKMR